MDKLAIQLENVNFWKHFIEESKKDGKHVHPRMELKLIQEEEKLLMCLLEKHSITQGYGNAFLFSRTLH